MYRRLLTVRPWQSCPNSRQMPRTKTQRSKRIADVHLKLSRHTATSAYRQTASMRKHSWPPTKPKANCKHYAVSCNAVARPVLPALPKRPR